MMSWRRWAAPVVRPLLRYPYAVAAGLTYVFGLFLSHRGITASWYSILVISLCGILAFMAVPQPPSGRFARRRMMEGAWAALLVVDLVVRQASLPWLSFLAFPTFMAFVYAGFRIGQLSLLLILEFALRASRLDLFGDVWVDVIPAFSLLAAWTGLSVVFRWQEGRKRTGMSDRLKLYEQEASAFESHAKRVESELRVDDKKKFNLVNMMRDQGESFRNLLDILSRTLRPHTCVLYVYDAAQEVFLLKEYMTSSDRFCDDRVQASEGIFRAVLREKQSIRMVSPLGELRGLQYYDGPPMVRAVLAVPLKSGTLIKGVLILDRLEPTLFSEEEVETIERVADQIERAMESSESLHAYFHLKEELTSFYAASSALNRSLKTDDVVQTLLHFTHEIAKYDWGVVVLHDAATDTNLIVAQTGDYAEEIVGKTFGCAPSRGLVSWAIKNQTPLAYTSFRRRQGRTPLFNGNLRVPNIFESVVIDPLRLNGEPLGATVFASRTDHFFSKSVRKMYEVIALQASSSLKNARMVGELEKLATTDGLTGLVNHRTFQEHLIGELDRAARHPTAISLLLVDIDFFKRFNDEYGHPIGDFVLREIGKVLRKTVRKVDLVSRYGGEEFAVILLNTTSLGAQQMAERIVSEVQKAQFEHQGLTLRVTVSIGAATYPDDAQGREGLIECADRALYESKHKGRNRATLYRPDLGKMNPDQKEKKLIQSAEDELRRMVDRSTHPV